MVMNGFDTNFDRANEMYAANTIPFAYMDEPIPVKRDELVRIYLVNVLEYDLINSFHLHGNLFHYFPTGTSKTPSEFTDTVMLCQGQRGILEWSFPYAGQVHVPRAPVRVHRARLAGLLRGRADGGQRRHRRRAARAAVPVMAARARPLLLIAVAIGAFALLDGPGLGERRGPPAEELAVERTKLEPGVIELTVRNDGPDAVTIAQARRQRRVRAVLRRRAADRPAGDRRRCGSSSRGSRARRTRSRCSPRPAGRSRTRSPSRSRRPPATCRSSG